MRLVLVHIIAVHASLPAESSPLTLYLQKLQVVRNHFILTCPSDEETMIINALNEAHPGNGITRYQCNCGYKYFVADCGNVVMALKCPDCTADLGGHQYGVPATGQQRLDNKPILQNVGNKDKPGYIVEGVVEDPRRNVRTLASASYRILHLFVHALIGVSAPSPNVNAFLNAGGNPINDPIAYCRNHITNDWAILKTVLACDDETLALIIHNILYSIMTDKPKLDANMKTAAARDQWEQYFRDKYVTPIIKNVAATTMDIRTKMERAEPEEKQKAALLETEINETLLLTDEYSRDHLPGLWRKIVDVNRESFAAYFANNEQYKATFPFINVFFKHEEKLPLVRHLWPMVKFTQTLTSRLSYRLARQKAQQTTFREFINSEDQNGVHKDVIRSLLDSFENFKNAWNSVRCFIDRYQCHELGPCPEITLDSSITFGLLEDKDVGIYLCAMLEYLMNIQNQFLTDVVAIPPGSCRSLKFIERQIMTEQVDQEDNPVFTTTTQYYIMCVRLEDARQQNIIEYEWDEDILKYSQRNLNFGHGQEISYDLYKIEAELALWLVRNKALLEPVENNGLPLEKVAYHMELFETCQVILEEIKKKIPQEPIPHEKVALIIGTSIGTFGKLGMLQMSSIENPSELLSALEILLCFVKRTSTGDSNVLLNDYVKQWMKLETLEKNAEMKKILKAGLELKHVVSLYELVEDRVADIHIDCVDPKYKCDIPVEIHDELMNACEFEDTGGRLGKIPAIAFAKALKRFALRMLSVKPIDENLQLCLYLGQMNFWSDVSEEVVDDYFPANLLVAHSHSAYCAIKLKIDKIRSKQQSMASSSKRPITKSPTSIRAKKAQKKKFGLA